MSEKSEEERQKKAAEIMQQITKIKSRFEEKRNKLQRLLQSKAVEATGLIRQHLDDNKNRIFVWKEEDCPRPTDHWDDLYTQASVLILGRIRTLLEEWNADTDFFTNAQKELIGKFHVEFNIMENQVAILEGQLTSNDGLVEDVNPTGLKDVEDSSTLSTTDKVIIGVTSPIWVPIGLVAAVFAVPLAVGMVIKERLKEKRQIKNYAKNKPEVMGEIAEKILDQFLSDECVYRDVKKCLNFTTSTLNNLLSAIPKLLDDDIQLIIGLLQESQAAEPEVNLYQKKLQQNEILEGHLGLLYVTSIREDLDAHRDIDWKSPAIATGSFGEVYAVELLSRNRMKAAAKVMKDFATVENIGDVLLEEESLRRLGRSQFIVKFIGTSAIIEPDGSRRLVILMEYCKTTLAGRMLSADAISPKGQRKIKNPGQKQPLDAALVHSVAHFGMQICAGLRHMHTQRYIHRDLKPENILVTENGEVRLADVGLTKAMGDITGTLCGTLVYMAPEILRKEQYGAPADMYAVGIILWEMWYGTRAYQQQCLENCETIADLLKHDWKPLVVLAGCTPPPPIWLEKLKLLLSPKPTKRPKAEDMERFLAQQTQKRLN